jgi:hypothetical protein
MKNKSHLVEGTNKRERLKKEVQQFNYKKKYRIYFLHKMNIEYLNLWNLPKEVD